MQKITSAVWMAVVLAGAAAGAHAQQGGAPEGNAMIVTPNGSVAATKGPAQYFTGSVRVDPLSPARPPSQYNAGQVTFEPGAHSNWHTHPMGQLLIVTSGTGWVQEWNGAKREIKPGDVIWTPPGVKHWHGATSTTGMTHIAIQESLNGKNVDWMEKVSDEQYVK